MRISSVSSAEDTFAANPRQAPHAGARVAAPAPIATFYHTERNAQSERNLGHSGADVVTSDRTFRPRPSPRLRVGFVTPNLVLGGAEYWILGLLKYCDSSQIAWSGVVVTSTDSCDEGMCRQAASHAPLYGGPVCNGFQPRHLKNGYVRRFATIQEALQRLCRESDVILVWGIANLAHYLDGLQFTGQVILVSHGAGEWTEAILKSSRHAAHWLVGVSSAAAGAFRMPGTVVIHNGGDHDRCQITRHRNVVRQEWGAQPGEKLVGYAGRFSWEKNPAAAAIAARQLGPPFRAVYIGTGWKENEVKTSVLRVTPNAIFVPPQFEVGNALNALDVLLLASPSEGFSLMLAEAWLCGVPVVATRVGAVPELESLHGQLVVPVPVCPTAEQLADAVRRALADENRIVVERARNVAWANYTAKAMGDRWTKFFIKIVHSS